MGARAAAASFVKVTNVKIFSPFGKVSTYTSFLTRRTLPLPWMAVEVVVLLGSSCAV